MGMLYLVMDAEDYLYDLKTGDIIAYIPIDGDVLMLKLKTVANSFGSFIITGETPDVKEVFDYVKLASSMTLDDAEVENVEEGVEFLGTSNVEPHCALRAENGKWEASKQFNFGLKDYKLGENITITAMVGFILGVEMEYYLALGEDSFVRFEVFYDQQNQFAIEGNTHFPIVITCRRSILAKALRKCVSARSRIVRF